jgi:hypothetical protein
MELYWYIKKYQKKKNRSSAVTKNNRKATSLNSLEQRNFGKSEVEY